jgi:hypothetical protein
MKVVKAVEMIAFCMRRFKSHWKSLKSGEKSGEKSRGYGGKDQDSLLVGSGVIKGDY